MAHSYDFELVRRLEQVEVEAYASMFEGTGDSPVGVEIHRSGDALVRIDRSEGGRLNRVNSLGVGQPATEDELDAIVELYRRSGVQGFSVNVSPIAQPAELAGWLESRGFKQEGSAAKIYRRAGNPRALETDLRVMRVTPANVRDLAVALEDGFGMTRGRGAVVGRAAEKKPGWRWFVAYDGAQPVAAGGLFAHEGVGWLGYGATVPSHRKRGAQGAIIAARVAAAAEMGCEWVTSETAEDRPEAPVSSYHNMIRNGFELLFLRPSYVLKFE
jgi:hypothetical protein